MHDISPIIPVIRRLLEADEFDFLFSRAIEIAADLFTDHSSAIVTRRDDRYWVQVAYPARKTLHFPIAIPGDLSFIPMEGACHRTDIALPEMSTDRFFFFPVGYQDDQKVWGEAWLCLSTSLENDPLLAVQADLFADIVREAVRKIAKIERIKQLTIIDEVTGLYNTRHLFSLLDQAIQQAGRYFSEFSLIFFDLDHFKLVNDSHGHIVGSRLLREIGQVMLQHLRKADVAFRYGGDEFVVFLPYTPKQNAQVVVERLWENIRKHDFVIDGASFRIAASYGWAGFPEDGRTAKEVIAKADEAMYRAKRRSRDSFEMA